MHKNTVIFKRAAATVGLMSLLWLLYTLTIPALSHAAIFFDSDFETCPVGTGNDFPCEGWDDFDQEVVGTPPNISAGLSVHQSSTAAFNGGKGVRGIHDGKGTTNVPGGNTLKPSIYKKLPANTKHAFFRWAFREAPGFQYCAINGHTKLVRILGNGYPKIWIGNYYGKYYLNIEGPYTSPAEAIGTNVVVSTSAWEQLEFEWKLNTPGQADGIIRFWVDGNLVIQSLNRQDIGPTPTSKGKGGQVTPSDLNLDTMQIYMQCGLGTMYYDRVAIGNTRIGPVKSQTSSDTTPPASPQGLQVR